MTGKDYFVLGCKLFGVYCLVLGVPALATTIPSFVQPQQLEEDYRRIMMATFRGSNFIVKIYMKSLAKKQNEVSEDSNG